MRDLAPQLAGMGLGISVLAHHDQPFRLTRHEEVNGCRLTRTLSLGQMVYAPVSPSFATHLSRVLLEYKPDLLHVHMPNLSAFWMLLLGKRLPTIVHWHADVVASRIDRRLGLLYPFYAFFERRLLERARCIVATSENYLRESRPLQPFLGKCRVIALGIDPDRLYHPGPEEIEFVKNTQCGRQFTVLSVGRFTYYKGFQFLIEAARSVPLARFILVGEGPLRKPLLEKVQELGLQDRVHLPGFLNDRELHVLMAACDVFCLPSVERTEAFGLVLPEAMAFGKPLITTDMGGSGVNWVNQHGETGLVVPPRDSGALARSINMLQAHGEMRHELGCNARKRFFDLFHIGGVAREILDLYVATLS